MSSVPIKEDNYREMKRIGFLIINFQILLLKSQGQFNEIADNVNFKGINQIS